MSDKDEASAPSASLNKNLGQSREAKPFERQRKEFIIRNGWELKWLDGFDGDLYEWVDDPKKAWHFDSSEVIKKLRLVILKHPEAQIRSDKCP